MNPLILLAAVAIVYIVMVATFGSLIQPLLLLISIPFAATGALGLLLITDTPLGVPALIGMLLLIGIVVTNAIVLIDLVNQYRKKGKSVEDSLISGARQRLRPILMTALATIFALTPMALGVTGNSGFISQPLALVVVGGLISSTLLTLILVPVLYWLVEGRKERKVIRLARRAKRKAVRASKKASVGVAATTQSQAVSDSEIEAEDETRLAESVQVTQEAQPEDEAGVQTTAEEPVYQPAVSNVPDQELAWTEEPIDMALDDESSMEWEDSPTDVEPKPALGGAAAEMPATDEAPVLEPKTNSDLRADKKADKANRKAQIRAAKNSRHSND